MSNNVTVELEGLDELSTIERNLIKQLVTSLKRRELVKALDGKQLSTVVIIPEFSVKYIPRKEED